MLKRVCRMEAAMLVRMRVLSLLILVFSSLGIAGDKKKIVLPAYVLKARTVLVLIDPDAGTSMTSPSEQDCSRGCREGIDEMGPVDASLGRPTRGFSHYR